MRLATCPMAVFDTKRRGGSPSAPRRRLFLAFFIAAIAATLPWLTFNPIRAQDELPADVKNGIKAHFVYTAAKFVEWPQWAFSGSSSPIVFGVLGHQGFDEALSEQTSGKALAGRPIVVKVFERVEDIEKCHVLYVAAMDPDRLGALFNRLRKWSVLTVGEMERFTEAGGALNLHLEEGMVRFDINLEAARLSGLHISSKLAVLGRVVRQGTPRPTSQPAKSSGR
jgi:hypothetical protein